MNKHEPIGVSNSDEGDNQSSHKQGLCLKQLARIQQALYALIPLLFHVCTLQMT